MDRILAAILCISILMSQSGCSFFGGSTQMMTVSSHPEADLFVNGAKIGTGRAVIAVKRDGNHVVEARLNGKSAMLGVGHSLGTAGVLDIIGGLIWLVPFIGLLAPGAYKLDHEVVTLYLEK